MQNNGSRFSVSTIVEENEGDVLYPNATPPWPEWDEEELNSTNWDEFNDFRYRDFPTVIGTDREFPENFGPENIEWQRVHHIFPDDDYQIIEENQPPFIQLENVFTSNRHLMGTEFFRMLLYSLKNISFISSYKQAEDNGWEPWKHVYKQEYNPKGKYFVKLYFLGKWRKLVVDDYLPCTIHSGELLIPFISCQQLWLPLLSKAILVVASLLEFNWRKTSIANLLTGCFSYCVRPNTGENALWEIIDANVPHLETVDAVEDPSKEILQDKAPQPGSSNGEKKIFERYVLLMVESTAVPDLYTSVPVLIQLVINQCHLKKYAQHWKDIRYNQWAYRQGILKENLPSSNSIGHIQIFCPVRKIPVTQDETEITEAKDDTGNPTTDVADVENSKKHTPVIYGELPSCDEICTWLEFPQMYPHLVHLETLVVPTSFEHQSCFTSVEDFTTVLGDISGEGQDESQESGNHTFHDLIPQLSFYIYSDSLQSTDLYFVVETCCEYFTRSSHLVLKNVNRTSLVIEPFYWKDLALDFSNKGTLLCCQTVKLTLPPGVNVFRVWYSVVEHFYVGIFSSFEFKTVSRSNLNHLLSNQSLHISALVQNLVSKFNTLLHTPLGTIEHGYAYNEFIEAFCPQQYFDERTDINTKIQIKMEVLRRFEDILMEKILTYNFGSQLSNIEFSAMSLSSIGPPLKKIVLYLIFQCQDVFQNPVFGERFLKQNSLPYYNLLVSTLEIQMSSELLIKKGNRSKTSKIINKSSLSQGKQIRLKLREKRQQTKEAAANASKISMMNSALEDIMETNAGEFYSLLTATPATSDVPQTDVIISDLKHIVNLIEISGSVEELNPNTWSLIARLNLNLHSTNDSLIGLNFLISNAGDCRLQYELVRNRIPISERMRSVKMSNHMYSLSREEFGYTLLLYGYSLEEPIIEGSGIQMSSSGIRWKLQLITAPGTDNFLHVCQLYPPLETNDLGEEEEESAHRPQPFCNFGPSQSAPSVKTTECTGFIEADTKYERLKFRLTTWVGNIVTLRFKLESPCYKTTLMVVKQGVRGGGGMEEEEDESEAILRSCDSLVDENGIEDSESQDTIIISEESDDGEIIIPAIITTDDTCNHSNGSYNHGNGSVDLNNESLRNGSLILEGIIQIVYKQLPISSDQRLIDAKSVLIKKYFTQEETRSRSPSKETLRDPSPCERTSSTIPYSIMATYTSDSSTSNPSLIADKDFTLQIESDLLDTKDPEIVEAVERGKERRSDFLCKLFKDAPCLGHVKRKIPRFQVFLTEMFGREPAETPEVNRKDSGVCETQNRGDTIENDIKEGPSMIELLENNYSDLLDEGLKNKWRMFYDRMHEELEYGPTCYDRTRSRLYKERDRYIQFRNYEREKYAPNEPPPEFDESIREVNNPGKKGQKDKKKSESRVK